MIRLLKHKPSSTNVGGTLLCPQCYSSKVKWVGTRSPDRDIYRCKVCGKGITYIRTPMAVDNIERMSHFSEHPYRHLGVVATKIPIIRKLGNEVIGNNPKA